MSPNARVAIHYRRPPNRVRIYEQRVVHEEDDVIVTLSQPVETDTAMYHDTEVILDETLVVNKTKYRLFNVCNHSGGLAGGHYTALCRKRNNTYVLCNDDQVYNSSKPNRSSYAYILFYVK